MQNMERRDGDFSREAREEVRAFLEMTERWPGLRRVIGMSIEAAILLDTIERRRG